MLHIEGVRVCVVGGGPRFLSGVSYYTHRLICALAGGNQVSGVLARQLVPTRLYPGAGRVGHQFTDFRYPAAVEVFEGLDWFWGLRLIRTVRLLRRRRPQVLILQWWTGALLHTFLVLAFIARRLGAKVILEFHEVQDVGEMALPLVGSYVDRLMPALVRMTDAAVIHSEVDREPVVRRHRLGDRPIVVIAHGPYDHHVSPRTVEIEPKTQDKPFSLLYFGVIRPFKGVEDLIRAFDLLDDDQARGFSLTVAGETWERWTLPAELIAASRHAERITFINRYLSDAELSELLADADAIVLPYHRSSASGPLHTAMSAGLPVVVTAVGGLVEAAGDYEGAIFVPPRVPLALRSALVDVVSRRGQRYPDPHTWERTANGFDDLFERLGLGQQRGAVGLVVREP